MSVQDLAKQLQPGPNPPGKSPKSSKRIFFVAASGAAYPAQPVRRTSARVCSFGSDSSREYHHA
jgi:hypothetical protein